MENNSFRPLKFENFIGQQELITNLKVFVESAKNRNTALDHVLFYGPPGLGKTTLSNIIANELGVEIVTITAPMVKDGHELIKLLSNVKEKSVVFIDEIHRLHPKVEEILYSALEDFKFFITMGDRQITIDLPKFTLVGATTKLGDISNPLRDRFGIHLHLRCYDTNELTRVIMQASSDLNADMTVDIAQEIAIRSRGTPRIAIHLLKRVYDYSIVKKEKRINFDTATEALKNLDIDSLGLSNLDHRYLGFIKDNYLGKAVGVETIAAALYEDQNVIKDRIEPYLIKIGFVQKTPKGRMLTDAALRHLAA